MNPILASLYGHNKTAASEEEGAVDLNSISAADLLAGIESGEIVFDGAEEPAEKVATEEEINLSEMTGTELLSLLEQLDNPETATDDSEKTASAIFEKMASDGTFDFYDAAGRIMAHALNDEMGKIASGDDLPEEIEVNLDEMTGAQVMELMEQGYSFVDEEPAEKTATDAEQEKVAGRMSQLLSTYKKSMRASGQQAAAGHPAAKGAVARRMKALATTAKKTSKGERAAAAGAGAAGLTGAAALAAMRRKKDD